MTPDSEGFDLAIILPWILGITGSVTTTAVFAAKLVQKGGSHCCNSTQEHKKMQSALKFFNKWIDAIKEIQFLAYEDREINLYNAHQKLFESKEFDDLIKTHNVSEPTNTSATSTGRGRVQTANAFEPALSTPALSAIASELASEV